MCKMVEIYKPLAISLPFMIFMLIKIYLDTNKIEVIVIMFIIVGIISIWKWVYTYKKEKYLKEAIEWVG